MIGKRLSCSPHRDRKSWEEEETSQLGADCEGLLARVGEIAGEAEEDLVRGIRHADEEHEQRAHDKGRQKQVARAGLAERTERACFGLLGISLHLELRLRALPSRR